MGLLYHTLTDIRSRSSKHLPPERHRLNFSLIADAISDGWPINKTLDAGGSHPKETASAALRDCRCEKVIPNLRHFPPPPSVQSMWPDRVIGLSRSGAPRPKWYRLVLLTPFLKDRQFADVNGCNNN